MEFDRKRRQVVHVSLCPLRSLLLGVLYRRAPNVGGGSTRRDYSRLYVWDSTGQFIESIHTFHFRCCSTRIVHQPMVASRSRAKTGNWSTTLMDGDFDWLAAV